MFQAFGITIFTHSNVWRDYHVVVKRAHAAKLPNMAKQTCVVCEVGYAKPIASAQNHAHKDKIE